MSKKYSVKYFKDGKPVVRQVSDYVELNVLLSGDASGCTVETKPSEAMPLKMHNLVAAHNSKTLTNP